MDGFWCSSWAFAESDMKGGFAWDERPKMKGKKSRETRGVARVFLRKNTRKKPLLFAIKGLDFPGGSGGRGRAEWRGIQLRISDWGLRIGDERTGA
jgi:hypothetical protein